MLMYVCDNIHGSIIVHSFLLLYQFVFVFAEKLGENIWGVGRKRKNITK